MIPPVTIGGSLRDLAHVKLRAAGFAFVVVVVAAGVVADALEVSGPFETSALLGTPFGGGTFVERFLSPDELLLRLRLLSPLEERDLRREERLGELFV